MPGNLLTLDYTCKLCEEVPISTRPIHGPRQHYARGGPDGWEVIFADALNDAQQQLLSRIFGLLGGVEDEMGIIVKYAHSTLGARTQWMRRANEADGHFAEEFGTNGT